MDYMTFKKGDEWNGNRAGRTPGTGHRQQAFNELVMPHKEALFGKGIELALGGNEPMLRLFLERMIPAKPIDEPVTLNLSGDLTLEAAINMGKDVLRLLEQQEITPDQAKSLFGIVKSYQENILIQELHERLKNMQANLAEIKNQPSLHLNKL
jgi:hypothetical protein